MKKFCHILSLVLLLCLIYALSIPFTFALEDSQNVVTVAFVDYNNMYQKNNNEENGFVVEYMDKIASITGWDIRYNETLTTTEAKTSIISGAVQIMFASKKSEWINLTENSFDYSIYPVLNPNFNLYSKTSKNISLTEGADISVGVAVSDEWQKPLIDNFLLNLEVQYQIDTYPDQSQLQQALIEEEIDMAAMVSYDLTSSDGIKPVENLGMTPLYAVGALNSEVIAKFSQAQQQIEKTEPTFFSRLTNKFFPYKNDIVFTQEEQTYIANIGSISVGQYTNRVVLSGYDQSYEKIVGANPDILARIAEISGLPLISRPIYDGFRPLSVLKEGTYDLVMGVVDNQTDYYDRDLIFSVPYMTTTFAWITKEDKDFVSQSRFTIGYNYSIQYIANHIDQTYPQLNAYGFSNTAKTLTAIKKGDVDAMLEDVYVADYYLQMPKYSGLKINKNNTIKASYCLAVTDEQNPCLLSIINKTLYYITQFEVADIVETNATNPYKITSTDIGEKIFPIILTVIIIVLLVVALLVFLIMKKTALSNKLSDKNENLSDLLSKAEGVNATNGKFLQYIGNQIELPIKSTIDSLAIANEKKSDQKTIDNFLLQVKNDSYAMSEIVKSIKDVSDLILDNVQISNAEFDLKAECLSLLEELTLATKDTGVKITSDIQLSEDVFAGDKIRVRQVLTTVAKYILQFTHQDSSVNLTAFTLGRWDKKVFIRFKLSCSETCWHAEEVEPVLFLPFENQQATDEFQAKNSGLDMYIATSLVKLLHGAIRVENTEESGSTFILDIPFDPISKTAE